MSGVLAIFFIPSKSPLGGEEHGSGANDGRAA
jgi:hypothetical protein